ncbi:MAG: 30S ribosomal protein S6 [Bdellovibrionales bacterium RIFOXYD1_FULL_53_11]|nr:MAG: 30S ribosomal protein S6 [Bdellovibrionales bacterium RIFOXYD1_FULL_53_11]
MQNPSPGLLPGYETTFITKPELSDDGLKAVNDRIISIVQSFGGDIVLAEDWGKRKLAYRISKETRGHYTYVVYTGKPGVVTEIERNLRIHEHVIRFLTVNLDVEFEAEEFKKRRADIRAAAKRREAEREARREERERERDRERSERGDRGDRHEKRGRRPQQSEQEPAAVSTATVAVAVEAEKTGPQGE